MTLVSRWGNLDLILKEPRTPGALTKYDPVIAYFQEFYIAANGPPVRNRAGNLRPMVKDGLGGVQTKNGVIEFQRATGMPQTGVLDQATYFELDWRAYNLFGDRWKPCGLSVVSMGDGGPAIDHGYNGVIVSPKVRVDIEGQSVMNQRLCDVEAVFLGQHLGGGRSVLRLGRGTTVWSWHAKSGGNDESGDLDADKLIEEHEKRKMRALFDYMIARAKSLPSRRSGQYIEKRPSDMTRTQTRSFVNQGPDFLQTKVCGNLLYAPVDGEDRERMWPQHYANRDVSASAANLWVTRGSSTSKVHVAPFHNHSDCTPFGAPSGSPWR